MKPASIVRAFVRSILATAAIFGVVAVLAAALILGIRVATGDELESIGERFSGMPGLFTKLLIPFVLTWTVVFYNSLQREKANEL